MQLPSADRVELARESSVDRVGLARAEWAREEPGLDTAPMEIITTAAWITQERIFSASQLMRTG